MNCTHCGHLCTRAHTQCNQKMELRDFNLLCVCVTHGRRKCWKWLTVRWLRVVLILNFFFTVLPFSMSIMSHYLSISYMHPQHVASLFKSILNEIFTFYPNTAGVPNSYLTHIHPVCTLYISTQCQLYIHFTSRWESGSFIRGRHNVVRVHLQMITSKERKIKWISIKKCAHKETENSNYCANIVVGLPISLGVFISFSNQKKRFEVFFHTFQVLFMWTTLRLSSTENFHSRNSCTHVVCDVIA